MNVERLRKIIEYSKNNRADIESKVRKFYAFAGMNMDQDVLNILQIVRPALKRKGYLVLEFPFADHEIGALCYKGDALGYIVLNTSLPKVNVNFAICHEVYHVFYQESEFRSKAEFADDHYYEHEEEYAANLFAGMLLMPEANFRFMYELFKKESEGNEQDTIFRLMNYYQVPYMAALIRCFELELPESERLPANLLQVDRVQMRAKFSELWLDDTVLCATEKDDFPHLETVVKYIGENYVEEDYINERTLEQVLQNMRKLYAQIRGE